MLGPIRTVAAASRARRTSRPRDGERGQMLVLATFAFVIVLAFAGLVIDLGLLQVNKVRLQNMLDAASLSAGHYLPVDGSVAGKAAEVSTAIDRVVSATYPGLTRSTAGSTSTPNRYWVTYRCVIGVDAGNAAWVARDVPGRCDPTKALGHAPTAADFKGAGPTRYSACDPSLGDRCNAVTLAGHVTQQYYFGPILGAINAGKGLESGSTGDLQATAMNDATTGPADLMIILDRTKSMDGSDASGKDKITSLQTAAKAVLGVYNPAKQRVGLVLTGPSKVDAAGKPVATTCAGSSAYGTADDAAFFPSTTLTAQMKSTDTSLTVKAATLFPATAPAGMSYTIVVDFGGSSEEQMTVTSGWGTTTWRVTRGVNGTTKSTHRSGATVSAIGDAANVAWIPSAVTSGVWVPVGLSGTDTTTPLPSPNGSGGAYSVGGAVNSASTIVKAIDCVSAVSMGTDLASPIRFATWYLNTYGRVGVPKGIIVETDGQPQSAGSTYPQDLSYDFTCQAAIDAATAAKQKTTSTPEGIKIYAIGYGVADKCPTKSENAKESATWAGKSAGSFLQALASGTSAPYYFNQPSAAQLTSAFTQAAADLMRGSHLVDLCPPPIVTSYSPTSWTKSGVTVTVTGRNFSGATTVIVGGVTRAPASVSDTSISVTTAGAGSGVTVVTPCGRG